MLSFTLLYKNAFLIFSNDHHRSKGEKGMFKKFLSFVVVSVFGFQTVFPPNLSAQTLAQLNLPQAGTMISTSNAFAPLMLRGITIDPKNPLQMDFIVNTGDTSLQGLLLEKEALQLARYFLAALTTPETELWVNLSPNEPERIIPKTLGETEMGRDMLAQDYVLKQLTSSLMFPESELGKKFWDKVYSDVQVRFGSVDIPVETFNKVWIVPKKAKVYEHNGSAFVVESKLKVMLEEDYLSQQTVGAGSKPALTQGRVTNPPLQNGTVQDIIRQIILPAIEEEVNHGEHFAKLRQIFNALILSAWYKQNLRNTLLSQIYVDQGKTDGVDVDDKTIAQKIYNEYLQAFQKGAYDMIR
ncbi:MAG: hypothetical protein COW13_04590, partial [Candidatus Omnitrophica bacterium CG12_big_fil_rev_8_21_14_0_65_50_5]